MDQSEALRKERIAGMTWVFRAAFDSHDLRAVLADPEKALSEGESLKGASVAKMRIGADGRHLVVKKYAPAAKKKLVCWKYFFRPSAAFRVWRIAGRFARLGIPTAPRVAVGVARQFGYPVRSYYVTEALEGYTRLDDVLASPLAGDEKTALVEAMACFLRKLHDNGFGCRDLKSKNIFVKIAGRDGAGICLIDLDMVRSKGILTKAQKAQNIARLNVAVSLDCGVTKRDRLRFLRRYLGRDFDDKEIVRTWWNRIARRTRRKLKESLLRARCSS
jgi:hypothetical protein